MFSNKIIIDKYEVVVFILIHEFHQLIVFCGNISAYSNDSEFYRSSKEIIFVSILLSTLSYVFRL